MKRKIVVVHNTMYYLYLHYKELIRQFMDDGYEVICIAPLDEYATKLSDMGIECRNIDFDRNSLNPIKELLLFLRLTWMLRSIKPDIVFNFSIKPAIYSSIASGLVGVEHIYSMITGLGYVFTGNGMAKRALRFVVSKIYKLGLGMNTRIFFQNPDDREYFEKGGIVARTKGVVLNGTGIDTSYFSPTEKSPERISFLMIARLLKDKGVEEYLQAAEVLKNSYKDVTIRLLGPFDENPAAISITKLRHYIESGAIEYLGEKEDVRPYIREASVFVLPSYREGLPRATLEAMAMAKPVITTDVPGCRETVEDGINGYIVPSASSGSLVQAMVKFIEDSRKIEGMGKASRRIAVDRFDVKKVNRVIQKILNREEMMS